MTTHTSISAGTSQCDKILSALEQAEGWVSMPDLVTASGSYNVHSRISDLRSRGHVIHQRSKQVAGKVHSQYLLTR